MSYIRQKTLGRYGKGQQRVAQTFTFPASTGGVNGINSLMEMPPNDAIYTFNLMPSEYGMRLRKGYREWATGCVESPSRAVEPFVKTIIPFESSIQDVANDRLFAVTPEGIWNVTLFNQRNPKQEVVFSEVSLPAGYGVWTEFTGDAAGNGLRGHYLFYADGLNGIWQYEEAKGDFGWSRPPSGTNLSDWHYIDPTDQTTPIAFPVENVAFVTVHKQRIWVILENDDDAWYLPVASVTGELKRFTFGSKMKHGGNLVGLYDWTVDGGDGVDDYLVAISRGGDVILYQGEDPEITPDGSSVGPWSTRGSWFIGEVPESRRIAASYGSDLMIISSFGLVSMNDLLKGTPMDQASRPSRKVNRFLRRDVETGKNSPVWQLAVHPADGFLQIVVPPPSQTPFIQYTMNLQTGGWGFWEGVPIYCADSWNADYFMGGKNGTVYINDGPLDGVEIAKENIWQDVPAGPVPPEWTVPVPDEFRVDNSAGVVPTSYVTTLLEPLVAGVSYTLYYRVKDSSGTGQHKMQINGIDATLNGNGDGAFGATFLAATPYTEASLVAGPDFEGTFFEISVSEAAFPGKGIDFRSLTSFQAPAGHSNFNRVGFIRTIGVLAGVASLNVKAVYDYDVEDGAKPPTQVGEIGTNVWDSAVWDKDLWDFGLTGRSFPLGADGLGRVFAVGMSGNSTTRINIVGWDVIYQTGGIM